MPAAAVIPAPIAYIKVVAVKKLVVEPENPSARRPLGLPGRPGFFWSGSWILALNWVGPGGRPFYFEQIRVFKAGHCL